MVCQDCVTGARLAGTPSGQMVTAGTYRSYYSSKATVPRAEGASQKAIIISPDVFGLGIVNPKLIADQLNEKVGCNVYVPDVFEGKYYRSRLLLGVAVRKFEFDL